MSKRIKIFCGEEGCDGHLFKTENNLTDDGVYISGRNCKGNKVWLDMPILQLIDAHFDIIVVPIKK